ncbi:MAG: phosphatidate cytidylyltransferase [Firmicutes bacterium]|nr:phosphatidate cytidylyltransferase [Bacillota bacterium]
MLTRRLLTAVVGVPVLVAAIWLGGVVLFLVAGVLMSVAVIEVYRMFRARGVELFPALTVLWIWALLLHPLLEWPTRPVVMAGALAAALLTLVRANPVDFQAAFTSSWVALYLGGFFSFLPALRRLPHGRWLALGAMAVVWGTDTAAYFVGRAWGRRKLWPRISPGKTWAGAAGGAVAGTLAGLVWTVPGHLAPAPALGLGLAVSLAAQLGDLVESNLKRFAGVKDSGDILPGHGGILDRFDSALLALPVAYYLLRGLGIS